MDYSIKISDNGQYMRIVAEADVTIKIAFQWTSELVELTKKNGIKKYLFDSRTAKNISGTSDNYHFSYKGTSKLNLDHGVREALLVASDDRSHDFIETTKVNAGYDVKLFTDEYEAIRWLEK